MATYSLPVTRRTYSIGSDGTTVRVAIITPGEPSESGAVTSVDGQTGAVDLSGSYDALGAAQAVADSLGTAAAADTGDFAAASHSHPGSVITLTAPDGSGNLSTGATDVQTLADEVDGLVLGGDGAPMFPYVRRFNGNIPLTSAYWSAVPAGNYVYASDQTTPSENGIKVTNGTTTLTNVATPTGSFILDVKEVFATFADFPSTSTAGITLLLPSGFNFTTDTPSNDQGPSTLHSQATGNPHNVTAAEIPVDLTNMPEMPSPMTQQGFDDAVYGALVDIEEGTVYKKTFDENTILKADSDDTPVALPVGLSTLVGRGATGGITALSVAQVKALIDTATGQFPTSLIASGTATEGHVPQVDGSGALVLGAPAAGDIISETSADGYYLPAGTMSGYWAGSISLSSNAINSARTVFEIVYDLGMAGQSASSFSIYTTASNDGVGAAVNFALYGITGTFTREFLGSAGSATIGTTGTKVSTFTPVHDLPRYVSVMWQLTSINPAGANPAFGGVNAAMPFRPSIDRIAAGNNTPVYVLGYSWVGGTSSVWPSTVVVSDQPAVILPVGILKVSA